MFTTLKLALMTALMSTGMEIAATDRLGIKCIFEYDRIMPRVTKELPEEQKLAIRRHLEDMEGKPCHDIAVWANDVVLVLPMAMKAEQSANHKLERQQ